MMRNLNLLGKVSEMVGLSILKKLKIILPLAVVIACGQAGNKTETVNEADHVEEDGMITSLVKLIATPEKFHNKSVTVIGYINVEFEGNGLYIHKEDFENGLYSNGLWINLTEKQEKEIDSLFLNKKYVLIEGTFDKTGNGHLGLWSGEIKEITSIVSWEH
jgi:hypothetical protein